jgi:hypothetical protein
VAYNSGMIRQEISVDEFQARLQAWPQETAAWRGTIGKLAAATTVVAGEPPAAASLHKPSAGTAPHGVPYLQVPPRREPPLVHTAAALERTHTWLAVPPHFVLLVDVFRAAEPQPFELVISSSSLIEKSTSGYAAGSLRLVLLGDYFPCVQRPNALSITQQFVQGRFLLAATCDPTGRFRLLNGWSIEAQLAGQTWQLLHSNQGRKLRALGPVQTDARFGLVHWPLAAENNGTRKQSVEISLLDVEKLEWGDQQMMFRPPTDLVCSPRMIAKSAGDEKSP